MERHARTYYVLLLTGAFLWCVLIFLPSIETFAGHSPGEASSFSYRVFSSICHQQHSRSFEVAGARLAVCSRCTAIYVSFLFGIIFWRGFRGTIPSSPPLAWATALLPMLADVALDMLGIHGSDYVTRSLTGGWFGLISGLILTPLFVKACSDLHSALSHQQGMRYAAKT